MSFAQNTSKSGISFRPIFSKSTPTSTYHPLLFNFARVKHGRDRKMIQPPFGAQMFRDKHFLDLLASVRWRQKQSCKVTTLRPTFLRVTFLGRAIGISKTLTTRQTLRLIETTQNHVGISMGWSNKNTVLSPTCSKNQEFVPQKNSIGGWDFLHSKKILHKSF